MTDHRITESDVATDSPLENAKTASRRNAWLAALAAPLVLGPLWCLLLYEIAPGSAGTFVGFVLILLLGVSSYTDIKGHKIFNWATYTAFLWAVTINVVASCVSGEATAAFEFESPVHVGPQWLGAVGIGQCLVGAAACFFVMLFAYRLAGGGAGDVKLAVVIGAALGFRQGVLALAFSYVAAAVAILVWAIWIRGPLNVLKTFLRKVGSLLLPLWVLPPTPDQRKLLEKPIPLAAFFAIGTLVVVLGIPLI